MKKYIPLMKLMQQRMLVLAIIATSFGLHAADVDNVDKDPIIQQIIQLIYDREWEEIGGAHNVTSDQLAMLSPTKFPDGSTTVKKTRYTKATEIAPLVIVSIFVPEIDAARPVLFANNGDARTLADEAVEQAMYDKNRLEKQNKYLQNNADNSRFLLRELARVTDVSFNPSDETLEKQVEYLQKFGVEAPSDESMSRHFARQLIRNNPEQVLNAMEELPLCWFTCAGCNQTDKDTAYKLSVKEPWQEAKVGSKSHQIYVGHYYFRVYTFPKTNSLSSHPWEKIDFCDRNKDLENYNYYYENDVGSGPQNHGFKGYDCYRQAKNCPINIKGACKK